MNISNSSSNELWADFDRAENPQPRTPEQVLWEIHFQDTDHEARRTEELYRDALNGGMHESIREARKQAMIAAQNAVTRLHEERQRRESNG